MCYFIGFICLLVWISKCFRDTDSFGKRKLISLKHCPLHEAQKYQIAGHNVSIRRETMSSCLGKNGTKPDL